MWMACDVIRGICRPIICTATTSFFVSRALALTLWEIFVHFFPWAEAISVSFKWILTFEKFSKNLEIFWKFSIFYLKVSSFENLKNSKFRYSSFLCYACLCLRSKFGVCILKIDCSTAFYLKQLFFTKSTEHDLSLTSLTFDLGWPRVKIFHRMRRIDARRGTENFKALFPTKFKLLTKNHQGALCPPPHQVAG